MITVESKIGKRAYRQLYTTVDYENALFEGETFSGEGIVGVYCELQYHGEQNELLPSSRIESVYAKAKDDHEI